MNFNFLYFLGSILVFIGLFWMLLPHALHEQIIVEIDEEGLGISHYIHLLEGLIPTILGLILMIYLEKHQKYQKQKYINSKHLNK